MVERITVEQARERFREQGVSSERHIAFLCPICGTVQSMASLVAAGAKPESVERYVGFSCEGRFSGAGPWPRPTDKSPKAVTRRATRGCDWTLGGLFSLHKLEVTTADGKVQPSFEIARPADAQSLEAEAPSHE